MAPERDPLHTLRTLARRQARGISPSAGLVAEVRRAVGTQRRTGSSRRRLLTLVLTTTVVAASAVGAAAVFLGNQPSRPESGIVCRATPELGADAVVIGAGDDPIESCAAAWASGRVPGAAGRTPPPLTACIGPNGAIEVFPNLPGCDELGLGEAATQLVGEAAAVVQLQTWATDEVNLADCRPAVEVVAAVEQQLDELDLVTWSVEVGEGPPGGTCAKVQVDSPSRLVLVVEI